MALPKKNQMTQFLVPMVDATDFASIESGVTASQFNAGTRKFYGVNHNGSAATTSGAISKLASLVRSGIFRITAKATECNYDRVQFVFDGVTGCAQQQIWIDFVDNDDSDIMSALTVIQSMASDAASAAQQGNSRLLVNQSVVSDIYSNLTVNTSRALLTQSRVSDIQSYLVAMSDALSDAHSDLASKIGNITVTIGASDISDIASAVVAGLPITSVVSDIYSNLLVNTSRALLTQSRVSDIYSLLSDLNSAVGTATQLASRVWSNATGAAVASRVLLNLSRISDLQSALSDLASDIRSVAIVNQSVVSDIYSNLVVNTSRALLTQSRVSDIQSYLVAISDALSDAHSDLASKIGNITVTIGASDISDIASAVVAGLPITSQISDIYSLLSDFQSDFQSRVPKAVATNSQLSDLASDIKSAVGVANSRLLLAQSVLSDAYSNLTVNTSRALLTQSRVSDIYSMLSDFNSATTATLSSIQSDLDNLQTRTVSAFPRIKKNTALTAFPFKMVEDGDHITAATGLTVTATRSLDGAAFGACANAVAEIGSGWYKITLAAGDLNGDTVALKFTATGADQRDFTIITES